MQDNEIHPNFYEYLKKKKKKKKKNIKRSYLTSPESLSDQCLISYWLGTFFHGTDSPYWCRGDQCFAITIINGMPDV